MATEAEALEAANGRQVLRDYYTRFTIQSGMSKTLGRPATVEETDEAIMAAGRTALYTEHFNKLSKENKPKMAP